jgi:hypothetical protein
MMNDFLRFISAPSYEGRPEITVLSTHRWPNFGDRLGFHLLPQLVPPQIPVVYVSTMSPDQSPPTMRSRLLILHLGTSVFSPLLNQELISFVQGFPYSIGIFGTQYREQLHGKSQLFHELLNHLTIWCARYKEDLDQFDRPANGVHFGDWLIDLFPLTYPVQKSGVTVPAELRHTDVALDRIIQHIQQYSHVHSARLHPLLCALTSAASFSYEEQREYDGSHSSGKFRSLFLDVFHVDYPENQIIPIDRQAVAAYKLFVRNNILQLASAIKVLFSNDLDAASSAAPASK